MTKRDYELIASVFKAQIELERSCGNSELGADIVIVCAQRMAYELLNTNRRFDCNKFLAACGALDSELT
jgi:hypothetical protein